MQAATQNSIPDLMSFLDASPTPYHAVESVKSRLDQAGFKELKEDETWPSPMVGKFYCIRGGSSIIALNCPKDPAPGLTILGAHTDSPHLRVKPNGEYDSAGYTQVGVEVYGGVLLTTWFDRDLGMAGKVMVRDGKDLVHKLVRFDDPFCRVSNLAIHLNATVNTDGFTPNRQTHMPPIVALAGEKKWKLNNMLADELKVKAEDILAFDLSLFDVQPAALSGPSKEFLHSARLDNLAMCHAGLSALIAAGEKDLPKVSGIALFDHEEVGSHSAVGAASSFLESVLGRIFGGDPQTVARNINKSIFLSADMAHAIHPNYKDKHDNNYSIQMNKGPVIKINNNQRYATNAETEARFAQICDRAGVPYQKYIHRTDLGCGSTIGPIMATRLGIPTVDFGNAQLSMHSIRECCGTSDHDWSIAAIREFMLAGS